MPRATLRSWQARGRWWFVGRIAAIGALSGFFAWGVVLVGHFLFGMPVPSRQSLILAVPRGALFGAIMGLVLDWILSRRSRSPKP